MENKIDHDSEDVLPVDPENLVAEVRTELSEIDAMEVSVHAASFEKLHQKLNRALSSIDGM
jgi:hypothetical protein